MDVVAALYCGCLCHDSEAGHDPVLLKDAIGAALACELCAPRHDAFAPRRPAPDPTAWRDPVNPVDRPRRRDGGEGDEG